MCHCSKHFVDTILVAAILIDGWGSGAVPIAPGYSSCARPSKSGAACFVAYNPTDLLPPLKQGVIGAKNCLSERRASIWLDVHFISNFASTPPVSQPYLRSLSLSHGSSLNELIVTVSLKLLMMHAPKVPVIGPCHVPICSPTFIDLSALHATPFEEDCRVLYQD